MSDNISKSINKESYRFLWSHHSQIHRFLVKIFNRVMQYVPFAIKYGVGQYLRSKHYPYCLIKNGGTVIQVGAPIDTLRSGRSRGMHFALSVGKMGNAVIIEPDVASKKWFGVFIEKYNLPQIKFSHSGAWNEKKILKFYIDPLHPATNFTEGTREYSFNDMAAYDIIEMPVNTIDNILNDMNITNPFLVSITTNGAEHEILKGLQKSMSAGLPYIALARTGEEYIKLMNGYGYRLYAHDDRGYTFKNELIE